MKPHARLIALNKPGKEPQVLALKNKQTLLGREKGCKIRIPSTAISRQHCRLSILNDMLTVEDLGSSNGTYVNEVKVTELSYLKPGDVLRVGPFRFLVHYHLSEDAVRYLIGFLIAANDKSGEPSAEQSIDVELIDPDAPDILGTAPMPSLKPK